MTSAVTRGHPWLLGRSLPAPLAYLIHFKTQSQPIAVDSQ